MSNNIKIILLLVIILVLSGTIGFLSYDFFVPKHLATNQPPVNTNQELSNNNQPIDNTNQNLSPVNESFNPAAADPYSYDNKLELKAVQEADIKYCDQLKEDTKDNCIYIVAINVSKDFCQQISNSALMTKCFGHYQSIQAFEANDLKACLDVSDQMSRRTCMTQLFIQQNDLAYCKDLQAEDKILCEDLINKNIAVKEVNQEICEKIQDQGVKSDCINTINNLPKDSDKDGIQDYLERSYGLDPFKADSDGDGLSDYDEIFKYKTNPSKADTDGDGYSDGEEVKNGYNPLGN